MANFTFGSTSEINRVFGGFNCPASTTATILTSPIVPTGFSVTEEIVSDSKPKPGFTNVFKSFAIVDPIKPSQLAKAPTKAGNPAECIICYQSLEASTEVTPKVFSCDNYHQYCLDCFVKWAQDCTKRGVSPRCPTCRVVIPKVDLDLAISLQRHIKNSKVLQKQLHDRQQARQAEREAKILERNQARRDQAMAVAMERFKAILINTTKEDLDSFNATHYRNLSQLRGELERAWLESS